MRRGPRVQQDILLMETENNIQPFFISQYNPKSELKRFLTIQETNVSGWEQCNEYQTCTGRQGEITGQ